MYLETFLVTLWVCWFVVIVICGHDYFGIHRVTQSFLSQRTYRAMYDYSAQDEDEVSFRDGDYIVNVQPIDDGWMYGTVQRTGKTGMLPANYIEFVN